VSNRDAWNAFSAEYQERHRGDLEGERIRAWGVWRIPESELRVLGDVAGLDVLELGCGAAQWSVALAEDGARAVGLDVSDAQLEAARERVAAAGVDVELVHSGAEDVPLPDGSFDVVFCDHGAMNFADPYLLIPEAARLLRPGGLLAWCWGTPLVEACWPVDAEHPGMTLVRDVFGMHRFDAAGLENFMLPHSETVRALRSAGFAIEDLLELRPPPEVASSYRGPEDHAWARRWPMEEIWRARLGYERSTAPGPSRPAE
jgi:SAM-dependent methyltransferase